MAQRPGTEKRVLGTPAPKIPGLPRPPVKVPPSKTGPNKILPFPSKKS